MYNFAVVTQDRTKMIKLCEQVEDAFKYLGDMAACIESLQYIPDEAFYDESYGIHICLIEELATLNMPTDKERSEMYHSVMRQRNRYNGPGLYDNNFNYVYGLNDIYRITEYRIINIHEKRDIEAT